MRTLIVGCGYVGLPLAAELARQGHEVFGLRRSESADAELKRAGITPLHGDITRPESLTTLPSQLDWIVNCVASGGGNADDYRRLYLQGTRNLVEWLAPTPPKKFVYTSSTGVYGQTDGSLVTETSLTEPATETAKVLLETERVLMDAVHRGGASVLASRGGHRFVNAQSKGSDESLPSKPSLPAVILRVAGIYGPERGYLLKQFLRGEARIEGKGERILNMIHRDDLIGVIIAALENGKSGEIYNAADDEPVSQLDFFIWLAGKLGKPLPPAVPADYELHRNRGITSKKVSNRKLKMELGYQFKYLNFRKGYTAELNGLERAGLLDS